MPRKPKEAGTPKEIRTVSPELVNLVESADFNGFGKDGIVFLQGKQVKIGFACINTLGQLFQRFNKNREAKLCLDYVQSVKKSRSPVRKEPPKEGDAKEYKATEVYGRRNALIPVAHLFPSGAPKEDYVIATFEKNRIIIESKEYSNRQTKPVQRANKG